MTTTAEIFQALYRIEGMDLDLSGIRVHHSGADALCRAWGAQALTVGSDIYFRTGFFAPHTREGLWLLAHEVAHVVQQCHGLVDVLPLGSDLGVAPSSGPAEREADAAASAVLAGRRFMFASRAQAAARGTGRLVIQRYMAWEHLLLGNLAPEALQEAVRAGDREGAADGFRHLEAQCALLDELGRSPEDVDIERLRDRYPDLETLRLPGSGIVVTLGELNILPDYLSHPAVIGSAPTAFILPLVQSIRSQGLLELQQVMDSAGSRPRLRGAMRYSRKRRTTEFYEAIQVDSVGKKCGFPKWELYSSVVGRNAGHFAPFSWYRWQAFHLMAREMIDRSAAVSADTRDQLRARAQLYAGYADHFLQDSFAAGHLINKTLIMQWYVEWLASSRIPVIDRRWLSMMTYERQPLLHGPDYYYPEPAEAGGGLYPRGNANPHAVTDPQTAVEAETLDKRIQASGVTGRTEAEQRAAYLRYLSFLSSSVAQLAAGVVHGYFNNRSLVVASHANGPRYRICGDRTMFTTGAGAAGGAGRAAEAASSSRRAISELLRQGGTDVTSREIFESFPDHVEADGVLLTLPEWHDKRLRDQCFQELFGLRSTQAARILLTLISRRLGVPSANYAALRADMTI